MRVVGINNIIGKRCVLGRGASGGGWGDTINEGVKDTRDVGNCEEVL